MSEPSRRYSRPGVMRTIGFTRRRSQRVRGPVPPPAPCCVGIRVCGRRLRRLSLPRIPRLPPSAHTCSCCHGCRARRALGHALLHHADRGHGGVEARVVGEGKSLTRLPCWRYGGHLVAVTRRMRVPSALAADRRQCRGGSPCHRASRGAAGGLPQRRRSPPGVTRALRPARVDVRSLSAPLCRCVRGTSQPRSRRTRSGRRRPTAPI